MSTSYPYLQIARETDSDYGDVLSYSDAIGLSGDKLSFWHNRAYDRLSDEAKMRILRLNAERKILT